MKNKTNKIITLLIIFTIFLVILIIFILNYSKDDSSFSLLEKKWLNDNINNVIDVSVFNDVPIYGENGKGVIFEYLDEFTKEHNIDFNKVSYLSSSEANYENVAFKILNYNEELANNDIKIGSDHYVLVSTSDVSFDNITDIKDTTIGVFNSDMTDVSYYLNTSDNVSYTSYDSIDKMIKGLTEEKVSYIAIPMNMYMTEILSNNLNVVYHISELTKTYVLNISKDKTFLNIMKKYDIKYQDEYMTDTYRNYFLEDFFMTKKITESEKMTYNSTSYTYGYVVNMPFENTIKKEFVGTLSNYLSAFQNLTDVDLKIVKYNSVAELKKAFSDGEVDIIFDNFNLNGINVDTILTVSPFEERYVVLANDNKNINSMRSLHDQKVYMVAGTYLHSVAISAKVKAITYNNTDELLRNVDHNSTILIDEATYNYYKERKFSDYQVIYNGILDQDYRFVIRDVNKNKTFSELFKYYVFSTNYSDIKYDYNTNYIVHGSNTLGSLLQKVFITLAIIFGAVITFVVFVKRHNKKKKSMRKEDKFKFIDVMTSLKNRNYLNYNIKKWDDNVIYPQTIIIIDLNNIKFINDNHGHSEGDKVIKQAANILMMDQLENSDIIRTDGNEFLIYLVGYEEKDIITYTRRLSKDLKELPYNFGATLGYSTITDNVKTIDDAINEATLSMREAKQKQ